MTTRASGIVMHLSSLPGAFGIGGMGKEGFRFVDFLACASQGYWQVLPLGPVGTDGSPYQSYSTAAGNPLLIDLELLLEEGLLLDEELSQARCHALDQVDFSFLETTREPLLRRAFGRRSEAHRAQMARFARENADWLPDYALFMALRRHFDGKKLEQWPDRAIVQRKPVAIQQYAAKLAEEIDFHIFVQTLFFRQWNALRAYANQQDIRVIGDLPMYVSADSVDVWVHPQLFRVGVNREPSFVAGVPPDGFSETGQLWGNPLYNWANHAATGYDWWVWRISRAMALYDCVRLDHFRGFDSYWEIPAAAAHATQGRWRRGPGMELLQTVFAHVKGVRLIAEDLGDLSDSARKLVTDSRLPGMRILACAFDPEGESAFLPHNCPENTVLYTSTHDTAPFLGWLFEQATEPERQFAVDYLRLRPEEGFCWGAISGAWGSVCRLAMSPMQDVLGLGMDARMNAPGTVGGLNWRWRVRPEGINHTVADRLGHITRIYKRA